LSVPPQRYVPHFFLQIKANCSGDHGSRYSECSTNQQSTRVVLPHAAHNDGVESGQKSAATAAAARMAAATRTAAAPNQAKPATNKSAANTTTTDRARAHRGSKTGSCDIGSCHKLHTPVSQSRQRNPRAKTSPTESNNK